MDNKNHNDHNKQCNTMSASELDHKTDYCLTNLKILAKIKVGLTGIDLSYLSGLSSISIGPAGVEIKGLTVKLGSSTSITTDVEGVLTNVKGTGITSVSGALVKLN